MESHANDSSVHVGPDRGAPVTLTFAALEAKVVALPDGPSAVLKTPPAIRIANALCLAAIALALTPYLLVQWLEPRMWMVAVAKYGTWAAFLLMLPGFLRGLWVMIPELWNWQAKLVEQSDHDLAQFRSLRKWLQCFPRGQLEEHRNFARLARERMASKLGLLVGGVDRLGVLPVLVAVFLLAGEAGEFSLATLLEMPLWQSVVGLFLIITYGIGLLATRMRLNLELYEVVLNDALDAVPVAGESAE